MHKAKSLIPDQVLDQASNNENVSLNLRADYSTTSSSTTASSPTQPSQPYKLKNVIAHGTFGMVYQAIDVHDEAPVAIKRVFQDGKYKNRELEILKYLSNFREGLQWQDNPPHANVLYMQGYYFSHDNTSQQHHSCSPQKLELPAPQNSYLNIVTALYQDTLHSVTARFAKSTKFSNTSPDDLVAKTYMWQLFRGLAYIHARKVIHRDIKPQNILIENNAKLVVCDFGSAKQ